MPVICLCKLLGEKGGRVSLVLMRLLKGSSLWWLVFWESSLADLPGHRWPLTALSFAPTFHAHFTCLWADFLYCCLDSAGKEVGRKALKCLPDLSAAMFKPSHHWSPIIPPDPRVHAFRSSGGKQCAHKYSTYPLLWRLGYGFFLEIRLTYFLY